MKNDFDATKRFFLDKRALILLLISIFLFYIPPSSAANLVTVNTVLDHDVPKEVLTVDILAINPQIKADLDTHIGQIKNPIERVQALHKLMFDQDLWGIDYAENATLTAQEVYEQRLGNCISLASLYIASARYLGLKAKFQSVHVPHEEQPINGLNVLRRHVNVLVFIKDRVAEVEFLSTDFGTSLDRRNNRVLSDDMAFSQFHNNLAIAEFSRKEYQAASQQLDLAISYYDKFDYVWSNFGVVEKFKGNRGAAEENYRRALRINKKNFSALVNIYKLLSEEKRFKEADKLARKMKKLRKVSPYYFAKLARIAMNHNRPEAALEHIEKGLIMGGKYSELHHLKSKVLYGLGEHNQALDSIKKAIVLSEDDRTLEKYQSWIEQLQATSTS